MSCCKHEPERKPCCEPKPFCCKKQIWVDYICTPVCHKEEPPFYNDEEYRPKPNCRPDYEKRRINDCCAMVD